MSVKWPQGILRSALGVVLIAAGLAIMNKANTDLVPYTSGSRPSRSSASSPCRSRSAARSSRIPAEQEWLRPGCHGGLRGDERRATAAG